MEKGYKKISDDLILTPQNKILYNDGIEEFTDEQIAELNQKEVDENKKACANVFLKVYFSLILLAIKAMIDAMAATASIDPNP